MLVIAKLDRLARNVAFVSGLMENGVEFVAAHMPTVNRLTVHILAAVAEEARMISARTKAALAAAKARGVKLGNPKLRAGTPELARAAAAAKSAKALARAAGWTNSRTLWRRRWTATPGPSRRRGCRSCAAPPDWRRGGWLWSC